MNRPASGPDRRGEPRSPCSGRVDIYFNNPAPVEIRAEMVDLSASGFRAAHACKDLASGCEIRYVWESTSGRARVMWTQISESGCTSGFLLL